MDLFSKHITESPLCSCGTVENASYFFLSCPLYYVQRISLPNGVSQYQSISLHLLAYGNTSRPYTTNFIIFKNVQKYEKYIIDTKQFT